MIFEEICKYISELFNLDEDSITMDTRFDIDLQADTFEMFEMVSIIEDEFDIDVPKEAADGFKTVGDVVDYVQHSI